MSFRRGDATFILVTLHILFGEASADRIPELQEIADIFRDWARRSNRWHHNLLWAPLKMRFFCGSIVGDVLTDPKHSLRSRGQLSSCMAYTLRCSVRRRLTTTEKSLFLERPLCLGDFNIDRNGDALFDAFTSSGLVVPDELIDLPRTVFDDPDESDDDSYYDQIAWFTSGAGALIDLTLRSGGNFNFLPLVYTETNLSRTSISFRVSDHLPLGVEFGLPD